MEVSKVRVTRSLRVTEVSKAIRGIMEKITKVKVFIFFD